MGVMLNFDDPQAGLNAYYEYSGEWKPNALLYWLVYGLAQFLSPMNAGRVVMALGLGGLGFEARASRLGLGGFVSLHSGLGLSIAREIISHMDGQLLLDKSNKSEYSGACFLIILPVRQA